MEVLSQIPMFVYVVGIIAIIIAAIIIAWVVINMAKGKEIIVAAVTPDTEALEQEVPEQETKKVLAPVRVEAPVVIAPQPKIPVVPPARLAKTTRYVLHDLDEELVAVIMGAVCAMGYSPAQVASIRPLAQTMSNWALEGRFQAHKSL